MSILEALVISQFTTIESDPIAVKQEVKKGKDVSNRPKPPAPKPPAPKPVIQSAKKSSHENRGNHSTDLKSVLLKLWRQVTDVIHTHIGVCYVREFSLLYLVY